MTRIAIAIISSLLLLFGPSAFAQGANWTVSEAAGTVTVGTATATMPIRRGGQVPAGAVLSTGAGSRAVLVRGKDFMTVNANSRVRIPVSEQKGGGLFDVLQEWGNAIFKIEKKPDPHFSVRTPYLAAVVKGTTFSITVSDQGASLQVVEGAVETSTVDGGAREMIRPGVVAMVEAADRMRLTVQDQQTRTIDSPARIEAPAKSDSADVLESPSSGPATPASDASLEPVPAAEAINASMVNSSTSGMTDSEAQVLTEAITAAPTNLGALTDGFVTGAVVAQVASQDVATLRSNLDTIGNAGGNSNGADHGNAGGNGNDAGNGNAGGNGNGADNGNAGGNGNGAGNGNAGGNGNGAGNGNAGGNGNGAGNGNAGSNGNGAGNSNAGGNGNGAGNF